MIKNCFHLCTEAISDDVLCRDEADFKAIWNTLAICAMVTHVQIYCICLMSNHIHILLAGSTERIESFFRLVKQKIGKHIKKRYGKTTAQKLRYELFPVQNRKAFCQEVAYILRNPYKAGICSPLSYRWSSASAYFNPYPAGAKSISEFHTKDLRRFLKTRYPLPKNILIKDEVILPSSFVNTRAVEEMFEGSSYLFFNLIKTWNIEDLVHTSHGQDVPDSYTDQEVLIGIQEICQDLFRNQAPEKLDRKALATLARKVRARFGCSRKQMLRVLPVDDYLLDRIL